MWRGLWVCKTGGAGSGLGVCAMVRYSHTQGQLSPPGGPGWWAEGLCPITMPSGGQPHTPGVSPFWLCFYMTQSHKDLGLGSNGHLPLHHDWAAPAAAILASACIQVHRWAHTQVHTRAWIQRPVGTVHRQAWVHRPVDTVHTWAWVHRPVGTVHRQAWIHRPMDTVH